LEASTFAGEDVFGSLSRLVPVLVRNLLNLYQTFQDPVAYLCMLVRMAATSYVGLHRFCNISKHNSPVPYTFGWNISLMNFTPGGLFGYASSKCMTSLNVPSSKGVSAGPIITAFLYKRYKYDEMEGLVLAVGAASAL
jgi:hypothetical protein